MRYSFSIEADIAQLALKCCAADFDARIYFQTDYDYYGDSKALFERRILSRGSDGIPGALRRMISREVLRNVAGRCIAFLKPGQIRGEEGSPGLRLFHHGQSC